MPADAYRPAWPAPAQVSAYQTTRGASLPALPAPPCWLEQVHGAEVVRPRAGEAGRRADAAVTTERGVVLAVKTADCAPVLFCDRAGTVVAVAHAGWRGLAAGVVENTVAAMAREPQDLIAWIGPHIGQDAFEVGPEVRDAFVAVDAAATSAFRAGAGDRWHADLGALVRQRLARAGVGETYADGRCTHADPTMFFSYRRARETGRMASLIWLT